MKKVFSVLLAVLLVFSLTAAAFADNTRPADLTGHTYTAYQIFTGTQAENQEELGNVQWGNGINAAAFLAALKNDEAIGSSFTACTTAAQVADAMKTWSDNSENAKAFAKVASKHVSGSGTTVVNNETELSEGYYLVVDSTADTDTVNLSLLQLTSKGAFEIRNKTEVPEVEKKVSDDRDGLNCTKLDPDADNYDESHIHTKDCYNWADANQVAIGDTVHFKAESAVPAAATDYDYYYFIIGDTLSESLTFTEGSIKVFIDGAAAAAGTDYTVQYDINSHTFEIALVDAIGHAGESVLVTYDAVLNSDAIVGTTGNPNEVDVKYSSNPNTDYDGTKDSTHPGFPDSTKEVPTGTTPKDKTLTYTTELRIYKVDGEGNPLSGAEFTLTGKGVNKTLIQKEKFTADAAGTYYKLKNGSYTETAPVTADYMAAAGAGATAGYVEAGSGYTGDDKITVGGVDYRAYVPATDSALPVYILVEANADLYDNTTTKYVKSVELISTDSGEDVSVVGTVDEKGNVIFTGLAAGDYTLEETRIPDGYNPISEISFTISCTLPTSVTTGIEPCTWNVTNNSRITYNTADNAFEITIANQKGNTLPETGGIGTTLFYIFGGILVAAAVVLLITKKRMRAEH